MKKLLTLVVLLSGTTFFAQAQLQIDKQLQMTGARIPTAVSQMWETLLIQAMP